LSLLLLCIAARSRRDRAGASTVPPEGLFNAVERKLQVGRLAYACRVLNGTLVLIGCQRKAQR
jgi:hypothetical protein